MAQETTLSLSGDYFASQSSWYYPSLYPNTTISGTFTWPTYATADEVKALTDRIEALEATTRTQKRELRRLRRQVARQQAHPTQQTQHEEGAA